MSIRTGHLTGYAMGSGVVECRLARKPHFPFQINRDFVSWRRSQSQNRQVAFTCYIDFEKKRADETTIPHTAADVTNIKIRISKSLCNVINNDLNVKSSSLIANCISTLFRESIVIPNRIDASSGIR